MATNLRLPERTARALRETATSQGRSQQALIREALDRFLGLEEQMTDRERAIATGLVEPGTPFEDVKPYITLPPGMTTLDLLDRDER